ncbi:hypothetical protein Tco_1280074, partial [Tanacetum coccineum]
EAANEEMDDSLVRVATTASSIEAEQDSGTDKAKTTRKWLKSGKHEHKNGRARKKTGGSYQRQKDKKDNSWDLVHEGRVIHHQTHPIGQSHVKNDTLDDEKAQERWDFTLLTLSKEAQAVSITDCQAGNPCEL